MIDDKKFGRFIKSSGYTKEFFEAQQKSIRAGARLDARFTCGRSANYPEAYGGKYIDKAGQLVVLVTEGARGKGEWMKEGKNREVRFSFAQLNAAKKMIDAHFSAFPAELGDNILSVELSEERNRIEVYMRDPSARNTARFRERVCPSPCVNFLEENSPVEDDHDLMCGSGIETKWSEGSVGYRAKKDELEGFVTCAHVATSFAPGLNKIFVKGRECGECVARFMGRDVDAAFCKVTDPEFVLTNRILESEFTLGTDERDGIEGEVVNMRGRYTISSGAILSANCSVTIGNVYFTNLSKAAYTAAPGDSGGVVFSAAPETGVCDTMGLHKGRRRNLTHSFFVKASAANEQLGLKRY